MRRIAGQRLLRQVLATATAFAGPGHRCAHP